MSSTTVHTLADNNVRADTVLAKALKFFDDNPDEILTRDDICVKWDCCKRTAKAVARALIREGVPRAQLPRPARPSRAARPTSSMTRWSRHSSGPWTGRSPLSW